MNNVQTKAYAVERIQPLPLPELKARFLDRGIPVIVEGYVNTWPAAKKWTPQYLADTVGDKTVPVVTMIDGDYANADLNNMQLKRYLALIGAVENPLPTDEPSDSKVTHYLAQMPLKKYLPELLNDLEVPPYFPDEDFGTTAIYVGGTLFSQLHYHQRGSATLCMMYGKKHVRLFAPDQTRYVYPHPWYSGIPHVSKTRHKHPDPERYPQFSQAKYYETTVVAGELLFIPIYWWHSIENEGFSISAVSFWYKSWMERFLPPKGMRAPYVYKSVAKPFELPIRVVKKIARKVGLS